VNPIEQVWGMIYMLLNMVLAAWMIGSITLLIVKTDEETGLYRDTLKTLDIYSNKNDFERPFRKRLRTQIKLYFANRQISDEEVLENFPSSTRRRVLRKLYLPCISQTQLLRGVRQQFVDAFLSHCTVEIFSCGEELLQRGSTSADLYLLVEGTVKLIPHIDAMDNQENKNDLLAHGYESTVADSEHRPGESTISKKMESGRFINDVSFFTETPQTDTVRTATVVKTLTLSKENYMLIAEDHPGTVGKILHNLLEKVEDAANEYGNAHICLTKRLEVLQAGSVYDTNTSTYGAAGVKQDDNGDASMRYVDDNSGGGLDDEDIHQTVASIQAQSAVVAVQDLIRMHINKLRDDHTTRFLFAASRGDTATIALMCDQGFDPNNSDYDRRTALMVAATGGCTDAAKKLLEYQANPNLVDIHGTTALFEAVKNGHDATMEVIMEHGGKLCMEESKAASVLCQTVFNGDSITLRRLLQAKIQVDAGDYDRRTAVHIASAEGNLAALKVLIEFDADLSAKDRWGHTVFDEAQRSKSLQVVEFLNTLQNKK
jgi:CRP-like cAMP-binding protein